MRVSDGKLCFGNRKTGHVWKQYVAGIMNVEHV